MYPQKCGTELAKLATGQCWPLWRRLEGWLQVVLRGDGPRSFVARSHHPLASDVVPASPLPGPHPAHPRRARHRPGALAVEIKNRAPACPYPARPVERAILTTARAATEIAEPADQYSATLRKSTHPRAVGWHAVFVGLRLPRRFYGDAGLSVAMRPCDMGSGVKPKSARALATPSCARSSWIGAVVNTMLWVFVTSANPLSQAAC